MENTCKIDGQIEEVERLINESTTEQSRLEERLRILKAQRKKIKEPVIDALFKTLVNRLRDISVDDSWNKREDRICFKFTPVQHDVLHLEDVQTIDSHGYQIETLGNDYLWIKKRA